jgi:transposase
MRSHDSFIGVVLDGRVGALVCSHLLLKPVLTSPHTTLAHTMGKQFGHVDNTERRLVKSMVKAGLTWSKVQEITGRSPDTIKGILKAKTAAKAKGAPIKLTPKKLKTIRKVLDSMVKCANAQKEVTVEMILKKARVDVCARTALNGLRSENIGFYKLKEKPLLQPGDIKERKNWAEARKNRSAVQWVTTPHAIIDNKNFQITRCANSREYAARRSVRGAYQERGSMPKPWLVKPSGGINKVKFPGVQVTAAVIKGKIRVWHYVDGKWNAKAAAHMYENVLKKALKRAYPQRRLQRHVGATKVGHAFRKHSGCLGSSSGAYILSRIIAIRPECFQ